MIKKILAISILATMLFLMGDTNVMAHDNLPIRLEHIMSWRAFAEGKPTSNCQVEFYRARGGWVKGCGEHILTGGGQQPNPVLGAIPACLIIRQGGILPKKTEGAPTTPPATPTTEGAPTTPPEPPPIGIKKPDVGWPTIAGHTLRDNSVISDLSSYLYNFIVSLAGILVFGSLVFAGFQYLTSAGDPSKMNDAKSRINSAFLGLLFIFVSYIILNTINPQLTTFPTLETVGLENIKPGPNVRDALDQPPCTGIKFYNLANYGIDEKGDVTPGLMTVTLNVPVLASDASPRILVGEPIMTDIDRRSP